MNAKGVHRSEPATVCKICWESVHHRTDQWQWRSGPLPGIIHTRCLADGAA